MLVLIFLEFRRLIAYLGGILGVFLGLLLLLLFIYVLCRFGVGVLIVVLCCFFYSFWIVKANCVRWSPKLGSLVGFRGQLLFSWFLMCMFELGFLYVIVSLWSTKRKCAVLAVLSIFLGFS